MKFTWESSDVNLGTSFINPNGHVCTIVEDVYMNPRYRTLNLDTYQVGDNASLEDILEALNLTGSVPIFKYNFDELETDETVLASDQSRNPE